MRLFLCILFSLSITGLVATAPPPPPLQEIIVDDLQGLILVGDPSLVVPCPVGIEGVRCIGFEAPCGNEELISALAPLVVHHPLTQSHIECLKQTIISYYRKHNHPLVIVFVPEQTIDNRILQLVVVEARLGKVIVRGDCRFTPEECFPKWVRMDSGCSIDERILLEDVSWMNTNPFRRVNVFYRAGDCTGESDVELRVFERRPWRIYGGADNTGSPGIGPQRYFAGVNLCNVFFPNNILSYQYTTGAEFSKFQSNTVQFVASLPWRDTISLFGGYANANPPINDIIRAEARSSQFSGRYTMPQWWAQRCGLLQCNLDGGFDYKMTNNNLLFGQDNIPFSRNKVQIGQIALAQQLALNWKLHRIQAGVELFWSPGRLFSHQTLEDFNSLRPGATVHYLYGRGSYQHEFVLPKWISAWFEGRLQFSNSALLASEQFALGGFYTIRGYPERIVNGDNAYCFNFELRSLPWPLLSNFFCRLPPDELVLLAFVDVGYAWDNKVIPGFPRAQSLLGIGPGLRYHMGPFISGRFDVGFPINHILNNDNHVHYHFSLVMNY